MRRRAIIRFSDVALKAALGVRQDLDVFEIKFDPQTATAEILLGGEGLPECPEMFIPCSVPMEMVQPK